MEGQKKDRNRTRKICTRCLIVCFNKNSRRERREGCLSYSYHRNLFVRIDRLIATLDHALLVVAGGLIVGVDDGVGGQTVGVVRLGLGVDSVNVGVGVQEEGEHLCTKRHKDSQFVLGKTVITK